PVIIVLNITKYEGIKKELKKEAFLLMGSCAVHKITRRLRSAVWKDRLLCVTTESLILAIRYLRINFDHEESKSNWLLISRINSYLTRHTVRLAETSSTTKRFRFWIKVRKYYSQLHEIIEILAMLKLRKLGTRWSSLYSTESWLHFLHYLCLVRYIGDCHCLSYQLTQFVIRNPTICELTVNEPRNSVLRPLYGRIN
ncbi:hypothetical protein CLF_108315, partial [Clonorchis sinensis]